MKKSYFKTCTFHHKLICVRNETIGISFLLLIKVSQFVITSAARVYV